jgi:DNA-binding transcriptional ArsR family regulator
MPTTKRKSGRGKGSGAGRKAVGRADGGRARSAAERPRKVAEIRAELLDLRAIDELAAVFASLGSAPRLRLLYLLFHRPELKVGELAELTGLTVSGVSTHLRKLRDARLVDCRRDRQSICCYLPAEGDHVRFIGRLFGQIAEQTGCCCC